MKNFYTGIEGIRGSRQAQPGDVNLVFHTYTGFLVFTTQRTHDIILPADQAAILLKRFRKHNLTWGFLVYGGLFVPILTFFEYRSQSKKIAAARK